MSHRVALEYLVDKATRRSLISFSFSSISNRIAEIFEPGTTLTTTPEKRLKILEKAVKHNFHAGVSLMPLLPFISDTSEHLDLMFNAFQTIGAKYVLPATITLFGNGKADSKTLVMNAVRKHFPRLEHRYRDYFKAGSEMPPTVRTIEPLAPEA